MNLNRVKTTPLGFMDSVRKPLEINSLISAVIEIADRVGVPAPNAAALLRMVRLFAQVRGLAA